MRRRLSSPTYGQRAELAKLGNYIYMVRRLLAVRQRKGWHLGAEAEADAGDQLLSDGLGEAASVEVGAGATGRERLAGIVEVHETYIGGEPGLRGGRAKGK